MQTPAHTALLTLRPHRPGDIGWIIGAHGELYASEFGWDQHFEALVARIAADFIDQFSPAQEACWIAERSAAAGTRERVGCVMLVQARDADSGLVQPGVAQLRLLLVHPSARGLGVGSRLTLQCEQYARQAGYERLRLWTQSILTSARKIYSAAGYRLIDTEPHESFGHALIGEIWELDLRT